jgi:membrane protein required for beta-lactamase induction
MYMCALWNLLEICDMCAVWNLLEICDYLVHRYISPLYFMLVVAWNFGLEKYDVDLIVTRW